MSKIRLFTQHTLSEVLDEIQLTDIKQLHYLLHVLRVKIGDCVNIFDSCQLELSCKIIDVKKKSILLKVEKRNQRNEYLPNLTIFLPIIKKDKINIMISNLIQLGVKNIIFYTSQHSANSVNINFEKLQLIMYESLEQCNGTLKTSINENIINIKNIPELINGMLYIPWEQSNDKININAKEVKNYLLVGPEGGLLKEEINDLKNKLQNRIQTFSFGDRILRTEVAACYAATLFTSGK